jgi:hypothetical protein
VKQAESVKTKARNAGKPDGGRDSASTLIRNNLRPAQEAQAIARRKAIHEELHPENPSCASNASFIFAG